MRLGELEIPDAVLDARDKGELLVFAGAGVSMGGTAKYPDFKGLIRLIESHSGRRWHGENFDYYLGSLENDGVDVHRAAQEILTDPSSSPNMVHKDLMRLFRDPESVRIVTTNFDEHFTSVSNAMFPDTVQNFTAPALPVGSRFSGIVYVHGFVRDESKQLVLTDRDFGKAYSTEGWARRFLIEAFRRYVVLFVGYSHNDPPMLYLTRGLTPEAEDLYAIAVDEDTEHWRHLGIEPIPYKRRNNTQRHRAVERGIHVWAEHVGMSTLDHKEKISRLLSKEPAELNISEDSYLRRCFRDRELLRFFYGDGLKACWLLWAENASLLSPVFQMLNSDDGAYEQNLAHWFGRHAVKNHAEALSVYMRANSVMTPHLWRQIGQAYYGTDKNVQSGRARWAVQLCMHWSPAYSTDCLESTMLDTAENGDFETAIMLFQFLTTPRIVHEQSFSSITDTNEANMTSVRVKMNATGGEYWYERLWNKYLKPRIAQYGIRLAELATNKLEYAYELQVIHEAASGGYDAVSWDRSAIEPSDQDEYPSEFHILVDVARDCFEYLIKAERSVALSLQARWAVAQSPLLVRLAIHAMRIDKRRSASTKLRWIIDSDYLASVSLYHEVFLLMCETFPAVQLELQKEFLLYLRKKTRSDIRENPDTDEGVYWHHELTILDSLNSVTKGRCHSVRTRLAAIRKKFPGFRASDHPAFTHYFYGVHDASESPMSVDALQAKPLNEAVRYLVKFKNREWRGPTRDGLTWILQLAVKEDPQWGLDIARYLSKRKRYPDDIWPAIVRGWGNATLNAGIWQQVLVFLQNLDFKVLPLCATAQLLYHGLRDENVIPDKQLTKAERLAFSVLSESRTSSSSSGARDNWYSWAMNDTGGIICEFLMYAVNRCCEAAGCKWTGLPTRYKRSFERMLRGRTLPDQAGRTILGANVHYLYHWDKEWTRKILLPAFDWSKGHTKAIQIWHGFLGRGKWYIEYLQQLLPFYRQSVLRIQEVLESEGERLASHVASVCLFSKSHRARGPLLVDFLHAASEKHRVAFARAIRNNLGKASSKQRHALWTNWLRGYWHERNLGKPLSLCLDEVKEMIAWCPVLKEDFPEAVQALREGDVVGRCGFCGLHKFQQSELISEFPEASAMFLLYLVKNHGSDCTRVVDALEMVKELVKEPKTHMLLDEFVEVLARRGNIEEAEQLKTVLSNHVVVSKPLNTEN